jgi:hypothetical protein
MPCVLATKKGKFMPNEIPKRLLGLKVADLLDAHFNDEHRGHGTCGRIKNLMRWAYDNPIQTVEDLLKLSKREISRIPNVGKKTVAEIEEMLAKLEIKLATREGYTAYYVGAPEPPPAPPHPIYTMKLHESVDVNSYTTALRVHGGWIYEFGDDGFVFVPYHGEAV